MEIRMRRCQGTLEVERSSICRCECQPQLEYITFCHAVVCYAEAIHKPKYLHIFTLNRPNTGILNESNF